jgi:hypothetical protein
LVFLYTKKIEIIIVFERTVEMVNTPLSRIAKAAIPANTKIVRMEKGWGVAFQRRKEHGQPVEPTNLANLFAKM